MYGTDDGTTPGAGGRATWPWIALGAGLALVVVIAIVVLLFSNGVLGYPGGGSRPTYGFFGGFFLLFLLVWVGFFLLRMMLWRGSGRNRYGPGGRHRDPAVMTARQRYARGEITREQYDQLMTDLGRRGRGPGGPLDGA